VSHNAAEQTTNNHRWNVNTSRQFDTKSYHCKSRFDHKRNAQISNNVRDVFLGGAKSISRRTEGIARTGQFEKQFRHRDPSISVPETDESSDQSDQENFENRILFDSGDAAESGCPETRCFDEECSQSATKNTQKDKDDHFEKLPIRRVADLEKHNLVGSVRIEEFQGQCCSLTDILVGTVYAIRRVSTVTYNAAEKGSKQRLWWEVVTDFLQTEQNTSDWRAKGDCDTTCSARTQNLTSFCVVDVVLFKHAACDVAHTGCNVHEWSLLAD
jgi:hypothetical protein